MLGWTRSPSAACSLTLTPQRPTAKRGNVAVAATLVELVMEYTSKLAEANSVELEDLDTPSAGEATVVDFRRHLEAQRRIFRRAA
jgi:hypothetical protein